MRDRLISTTVLRERRDQLQETIEAQRAVRADEDPFFKITAWLLAEWERAERDAAREYLPTVEAARLTGWSEQTLRKKAHQVRAGEDPGEGWEELLVRSTGSEWAFAVSTIPVKRTNAA